MGLLEKITETQLGYKGKKPQFDAETLNSTLHNQSSNLGIPNISRIPSILDENDPNNKNIYKSKSGEGYIDNLPK